MTTVRRSTRIRTKSQVTEEESSGDEQDTSVQHVETDKVTAKVQRSDGKEEEEGEEEEDSSSEEDYEDRDDDDYVDSAATKSKSRKRKPKSTSNANSKRQKKKASSVEKATAPQAPVNHRSKKDQEQYLEIAKNFQPTELFEILSTSEDVSIEELLREWLETYTENRDKFLQEFINLLLNCCGSVARVEDHDVHSNESSNETIGEIQLLFQRQKLHEFYLLISKENKKRKNFKMGPLYQNFVEFMTKLLEVANDLQLLYVESDEDDTQIVTGNLVLDLLTWLSSFSVCKIRCFRYTSTLTLYFFQDYLTQQAVNLEKNYLAKLTRQLSLEEKKKRPNKKTLEKLESTIAETQGSKVVIESVIDNIVKLCFVHRYKDVSDSIRSESMLHLSIWIKNYPEYFLKVTFLKYFGWLLSDSSVSVRLQVAKILPNLIIQNHNSKSTDNTAIRQVFERFKTKILEVAVHDTNLDVRIHSIHVLTEASSLGYLDDPEILIISSLIFDEEFDPFKTSSFNKRSKFLSTVAKFLARVINEKFEEFIKTHEDLPEEVDGLEVGPVVQVGIFIKILSNSLIYHLKDSAEVSSKTKIRMLTQAAEFLSPYISSHLKTICNLLISDTESNELIQTLQNSTDNNNDNDEDDDELDITPLFPIDRNSTILYLNVFHGLCAGANNPKIQTKGDVRQIVLPLFHSLLSATSIESADILCPLLECFITFSLDDWISIGYETELRKITDKIVKVFLDSTIRDPKVDLKYDIFAKFIHHIHRFEKKELEEKLLNQISTLNIHLKKYLQEKMDPNNSQDDYKDLTCSLYELYINKLTILGREYPIEVDEELLQLFLNNFVSRIPIMFQSFDDSTIQEINFKILVLLSTWNLEKWRGIIEKVTDHEASTPKNLRSIWKPIAAIIGRLNTLVISLGALNENAENISNSFYLKWSASTSLMDIIVAIKVFELKLPTDATSWKYSMSEQFPFYLHDNTSKVILQVFLYLESLFAKQLDVQLERVADEDANLNDLPETEYFDDIETQFLLYTVKLKGLMKLNILDERLASRMALNKEKLGPLFNKILDNTIMESLDPNKKKIQKTKPNQTERGRELPIKLSNERKTDHANNEENDTDIPMTNDLEPIEESSQGDQELAPIEEHPTMVDAIDNSDAITQD
ncbi:irr1p [Saccharomyces arboricola H-6]|uniref:Irr1p n=1 Tax=Saccharomyces arboricola (strain H-6 / AS 2.3317 / CBS 10644) TaxID=1160507 RepID=J8Q3U8_SACAR|nr:irr1p [Saccharomyces arboricola H-6]